MSRVLEARQIWEWLQWRLPPDIWFEAQQVLGPQTQPTPNDPELAAAFAELIDPTTTRARRLQLLRRLLLIIRDNV